MASARALGACVLALGLTGSAHSAVMRISPDNVPSLVESGEFDVIVDVRGHAEYERGHLPGAVRGISELPQECRTSKIKIGVYCWTGWDRSTPAAYYLDSQITEEGAKVYDLGGFQYYESPPIEEGPPQYTHEELVNICVPVSGEVEETPVDENVAEEGEDENGDESTEEESQSENAPGDLSEEQDVQASSEPDAVEGAEPLPPLFEEDDDDAESESEPEPSTQLSSQEADGGEDESASRVDTEEHEYAIVHRIRAEKAFALAPAFDYVVDTRSRVEYERGHIPGAIWGVEALPMDCKDAYIAVYCWHGWDRSSAAALYLASQGFEHVYDIGGLQYMGVESGDLSTEEVDAKPCPPGGSSADTAAIRAANPTEMPDSIVDGRKGCDGMINSGKRYDVCGVCEGAGAPCGDASSASSAHRAPDESAYSTGIFYTVGIISALCLCMMGYSVCTKKASHSNHASAHSETDDEKDRIAKKEAKMFSIVTPSKATLENVIVIPAHTESHVKKDIPPPPPQVKVNEFFVKFQQKQQQQQQLKSQRNAPTRHLPFAPPPPPPVMSASQMEK